MCHIAVDYSGLGLLGATKGKYMYHYMDEIKSFGKFAILYPYKIA